MSTPGIPGGSHRAASGGGGGAAASGSPLLLPVLSVLVVLGAIGLAAYMLLTGGDGNEQADPPAPVTQPTATTSSTPSDTATATASSEPTKDGDGGKNDGGKNDGGDGTKKTDNDSDSDNSARPVPQIPVYVFNQTTISGLAADIGASLDSAGWNVVGVDNWIGRVPSDTVYFYPGDRSAAERLSKDFPDISRVWPASAPMPVGALTVILADTARK